MTNSSALNTDEACSPLERAPRLPMRFRLFRAISLFRAGPDSCSMRCCPSIIRMNQLLRSLQEAAASENWQTG